MSAELVSDYEPVQLPPGAQSPALSLVAGSAAIAEALVTKLVEYDFGTYKRVVDMAGSRACGVIDYRGEVGPRTLYFDTPNERQAYLTGLPT